MRERGGEERGERAERDEGEVREVREVRIEGLGRGEGGTARGTGSELLHLRKHLLSFARSSGHELLGELVPLRDRFRV